MFLRLIWYRLVNMFVVASVIANLSAARSPAHAQEIKTKIRIALFSCPLIFLSAPLKDERFF